jgi:hypothetical protein
MRGERGEVDNNSQKGKQQRRVRIKMNKRKERQKRWKMRDMVTRK